MNEYELKDIRAGMEENFSVQITSEMENSFRNLTGDFNPLHFDDDFAAKITYGGGGHIIFGMLTASLLSTLAGMYLPGKYSMIHSVENISFIKPVYPGDVLNVKGVVDRVYEELKMMKVNAFISRLDDIVLKAKMKILVLK